jgi:molecular chaperone GrpE
MSDKKDRRNIDITEESGQEQPPRSADEDQAQQATGADDAHGDEGTDDRISLSYAEYEELKTLAQERDDYLRKYQRAMADYQNLQKRVDKFRDMARLEVVRSLTENILPMADSLERALGAAEQTEGAGNLVEGIEMVQEDLYDALRKLGLEPIESVGQKFDPHYHEAVMQEPREGFAPMTVVRELKKGFVLGDQVLRPAQVTVAPPK